MNIDQYQTAKIKLLRKFESVRLRTTMLAESLSPEDQMVQSMPDASPTKWHLAHTSWFFEALILAKHDSSYRVFNEKFNYLFNSYYESLGPRQPRPFRGLLSRPSSEEILQYRHYVNEGMKKFIENCSSTVFQDLAFIIELGLNHEEQHQELLVTDIMHAFFNNPLRPTYQNNLSDETPINVLVENQKWLKHDGGVLEIGHSGEDFSFDNELPKHKVLLAPFEISNRLVTCGEYLEFIKDGGYQKPGYWLSEGWSFIRANNTECPLYWTNHNDDWTVYGIDGEVPLNESAVVTHVNFFEASAFAEWSGSRLPTEFEWEAAFNLEGIKQMTGRAWQWTSSAYSPYPGFKTFKGSASEYNGKFMVGQLILRGSSIATPPGHSRKSYRNFFPPSASWQFAGIRLARNTHE